MGSIEQINTKKWAYYFFNGMINITDFDPNLLKIDKQSYNNIDIYYIGYVTIKIFSNVKNKGVNTLYHILIK